MSVCGKNFKSIDHPFKKNEPVCILVSNTQKQKNEIKELFFGHVPNLILIAKSNLLSENYVYTFLSSVETSSTTFRLR